MGTFVPTEIKELTIQNAKDKNVLVSLPGSIIFKKITKRDPTISFC
jgi:hypothetical protein